MAKGVGHKIYEGTDRRIEKKKIGTKQSLIGGAGLLLIIFTYLNLSDRLFDRTLHVSGNRLSISKVNRSTFEDYIPVRARVVPLKTVFLDAVQGGRVEEVLVEDGANVSAGQILLKLSNSDLQLSVMSTESRVMEQLNYMRDQELRFEQKRLSYKRTLVELNYNIQRLSREGPGKKELIRKALISQFEYDNFFDELNYLKNLKKITLESQVSEERLMSTQIEFFKEKSLRMEENLAFARKSLGDLDIYAPVSGRLSGFDMEIGQNITRGLRIGQVSNPKSFKLVGNIDEYYLSRVDLGQEANFKRENKTYLLKVSKIYPAVKNGQFEIDMKIVGEKPSDMRRGQSIQSKLILGDASKALLIPNGQFFQDTGGKWVFVVSKNGNEAYKRNVQSGRRNNRFIEILSGLDEGEEVITSSYSAFREMDRLKLDRDNK